MGIKFDTYSSNSTYFFLSNIFSCYSEIRIEEGVKDFMTAKDRELLEHARQPFIQSLAETMDLYGVTPSIGRLYAILYFEDEPMTLDEMRESLGMSKTSMSTGVRKLTDINMVKKVWKKGVRKDLYEAEKNFYKTFVDFFCTKWQQEVNMNKEAVAKTQASLEALLDDDSVSEDVKFEVHRDLQKLKEAESYYSWLQELLNRCRNGDIYKWLPKPDVRD